MKETQVGSLGWEDPVEKGMATYSSILAGEIPWTEEPGGLTVHGNSKSWTRLNSQHPPPPPPNRTNGQTGQEGTSKTSRGGGHPVSSW